MKEGVAGAARTPDFRFAVYFCRRMSAARRSIVLATPSAIAEGNSRGIAFVDDLLKVQSSPQPCIVPGCQAPLSTSDGLELRQEDFHTICPAPDSEKGPFQGPVGHLGDKADLTPSPLRVSGSHRGGLTGETNDVVRCYGFALTEQASVILLAPRRNHCSPPAGSLGRERKWS